MAQHNVFLSIPTAEMGKVDAHFYIYRDNEKLGQITISKGGLDYKPNRRQKPIKINWSKFDELMKTFNGE